MTREEILAMPAGREMDALVAEHIFGYRWVQAPKHDAKGPLPEQGRVLAPPDLPEDMIHWPPIGVVGPHFFTAVHRWSERIESAWKLVEHFRDASPRRAILNDGTYYQPRFEIQTGDGGHNGPPFFCAFELPGGIDSRCAWGDTAPLAICRAALMTVLPSEEAQHPVRLVQPPC